MYVFVPQFLFRLNFPEVRQLHTLVCTLDLAERARA